MNWFIRGVEHRAVDQPARVLARVYWHLMRKRCTEMWIARLDHLVLESTWPFPDSRVLRIAVQVVGVCIAQGFQGDVNSMVSVETYVLSSLGALGPSTVVLRSTGRHM